MNSKTNQYNNNKLINNIKSNITKIIINRNNNNKQL